MYLPSISCSIIPLPKNVLLSVTTYTLPFAMPPLDIRFPCQHVSYNAILIKHYLILESENKYGFFIHSYACI